MNERMSPTAEAWFAQGERVPYDLDAKRIVGPAEAMDSAEVVNVYRRVDGGGAPDEAAIWTSFLPGWPDGSFGWAKVDQHLHGVEIGPRLYVEYVGHGESDKPADYPYGTMERADLVEALWEAEGMASTFIVTFDYSAMVALELLSRQQERLDRGAAPTTRIVGVLLMNGGLFADGHTHPWFTTPVLKSPSGGFFARLAQHSTLAFRELMKPVWSPEYAVTAEELGEIYDAMSRRNGVALLNKTAGFVDGHKRNAQRWDLRRLFFALREDVSFHVVGSEGDPFEWTQIVKARERLGNHGLDIRVLPGGHLATSEHPDQLARIIQEVRPRQWRAGRAA